MTTYPVTSDPQSAGTLADGTTISHQAEHGRMIGVWENVKHHGAKANGTDDTVVIQAAIDAASGGTCFIPPGTYFLAEGSTLQWRNCYNLVGSGEAATIISSKNAYAITQGSTGSFGHIDNIGTTLRTGSTSGGGMHLAGGANMSFNRIRCSGVSTSTDPVIEVTTNLIGARFYNCTAAGGGGKGWYIHPSQFTNENYWRECDATQNGAGGFHIVGGALNVLDGGDTEGNTSFGILLDGTNDAVITNRWFEGNGGHNIELQASQGARIQHNHFSATQPIAGLNHIKASAGGASAYIVVRGNHFQDGTGIGDYYIELGTTTPSLLLDSNYGFTSANVHAPNAAVTWLNDSSGNPFVAGSVKVPVFGPGVQFTETSDPNAPAADNVVLYAKDNGSGKTQLVARFSSGAVQVIATQP